MTKPLSDDLDRETGFDKVMGVVALLFWSVLVIEALGIAIIVDVSDIEPRPAALMLLVPAAVVWLFGSFQRSRRRTAARFFPPYFG
jgi:hypothetical protein